MEHLGTVPLSTPRLNLRRLTFDDCRTMFDNWAGDPLVTRYLRWDAHRDWTVTAEYLYEVEKHYSDPTFYNWGICLKDGPLIGTIGVVPAERIAAEGWQTLPHRYLGARIRPGPHLVGAWICHRSHGGGAGFLVCPGGRTLAFHLPRHRKSRQRPGD